jgi:chromosome segregation ATPase
MGEHADATGSGELVVRNGSQRGKRLTLTGPTTVLGASDRCDIVVTGRDVGEVHCLITATASGPVLRSWFPDSTLVNGVPTAAGVLVDGDELQVGPCLFQLSWFAETLVPLTVSEEDYSALRTQAAAVAAQQAMLVEEEWQIREREQALTEQESQLAAVLDERHKKLAAMLHSLHDGREKLRVEREAEFERLRKMRANIKPLHCAAKKDRQAARKLLAEAKARIERESAAARAELAADRLAFDRETRVLVERIAAFEEARARTAASDAETERRLGEAWEMLAEGQRRLHADRRESEELFAELREAADRREVELAARERALDEGRERVEARVQSLLEESARLETRTAHARAALEILEQKRGKLEGGLVTVDMSDSIPLDRKSDKSAAQLLAELQQRDRDLAREGRELAARKKTLDAREADLLDERTVVAEQAAVLAVAQESWSETQARTLADLESLASAVHAKEVYLDARDRELASASQRCRQRERELWELRVRLEGWQSTLASHEISFAADRDRAVAELDTTREHLTKWEAALAGLCRKWAAARKRDRDAVRDDIAKAEAERTRYQTRLADLDRDRRQWLEEAAVVAEQALAVEQTIGELATRQGGDARQATRRVRVLRRRWERRFTQLQKELEVRREAAVAEGLASRERASELHKKLVEVLERRDTLAIEEFAAAADHLAKARTLDERAASLAAEETRRKRTDRELVQVRAELDRITATVMAADTRILDEGTGAIPLRPVLAAA